jgi:NAD+ synthase
MSLSNQNHAMLLSTGNKSELAVGYSTLYGDMCGGFNPLKDLYKTQVFALARRRNQWKPPEALGPDGPVISEKILEKEPSAELREHQKDEDSLPPYDLLDQILERIIEGEQSIAEITAAGFDVKIAEKVYQMVMASEYKRRQAAPGPNLSTKSFGGRMRRYPMVNQFK